MAFIQPVQRSLYNVFNPQGLKFLPQLCLGLSHLNEHRFRHNFKDCMNPLCSFSLEVENTLHFFLDCYHFRDRKTFDFPLPKWCLNFYFSLTLIVLFISSDTFHFKLFCLVILFTIVFTFPFLVRKYQLGHCWMCFILDFRSLCRSFCRKKKMNFIYWRNL